MKFATSLTLALLASVSSVLANPVPEAEAAASIAKAKRDCGYGHVCAGIDKNDNCDHHCKHECGASSGSCGGFAWQVCQCS
ncbi:hypothetical protein CcaverHIS002_0309880 [Cutaneotrichosporon cavernicola]|uniref:Invertebrate defensins family profile domain-containing protein n=1 Tax=Cutaneotrichosporon cavernicola TaxID=279322 RepID=A0AA48IJ42_9TREE|nr:uncharacterized protein CcaverHIS019_0309730 [Cutaneotrichosporon cavernicola]BEI83120.1 hypothetical protein CcaverHIS002_0309880 [Cutaneotrichosporon cavernicola]BEI90903.1 hypothetical protein CcaverHIS019_0309730 [Cutaneotrichosporon cavernicola]BEI98682.1 hypothetical protein CcaverHIS631_0309810 [Cutaneotrichosporon cavernicola]BEJ06452.1 hypothetical protein CcaverHIS641_0309740 [Cutaneotrichosporon cavernicola]